MTNIEARSASELWQKARQLFDEETGDGLVESRGGRCKERLAVLMCLTNIRERWVFSRIPPINLPFALAEVLWILTGQREASFLNFFNSKLPQFSGKSKHYHGAYGFRLRKRFGIDQLVRAYDALRNCPSSRQVVLQLWDSTIDLPDALGRPRDADIPCNIVSMIKIKQDRLVWTQIMRSNDVHLGLPYNIVQFTFLQEMLAAWLRVEPGVYTHFVDNLHCYERDLPRNVCAIPADLPANPDRIVGSKEEIDPLFSQAYRFVRDATVLESMSDAQLGELSIECQERFPEFLSNIVVVLLAETKRRKTFRREGEPSMQGQRNPLYEMLWRSWIARIGPGYA